MKIIKNLNLLFTMAVIAMVFYGVMITSTGYGDTRENPHIEPPDKVYYKVYGVEIPENLSFAGEPVPLSLYDIRESLDRELLSNTYFHSQTIRLIKLSYRYFPLIEPILKEMEIPDDFKYLAVAESGLEQSVSPAKAVGFWQLMKGTATDYGLEVNEEVDERYHIEKATVVACRYILESYEKYGNWTMAAASYNAGRRGVDRQIDRQRTNNYYDLLLNDETARYLFRVLSFKLIFEKPEKYGIILSESDFYNPVPSKTIEVNGSVPDFIEFANQHNTNYKILKYLNPWLRDAKLTNGAGKSYSIKVPEDGIRSMHAWEMMEEE